MNISQCCAAPKLSNKISHCRFEVRFYDFSKIRKTKELNELYISLTGTILEIIIHSWGYLSLQNCIQDQQRTVQKSLVCFVKLTETNCEIMSQPRDTLSAHSCNSFANINTAWPDCSDLRPRWCLGQAVMHSLIITHMTLSKYIITDSLLLANSCLMTSQILEEKKEKGALNFYFEIYIPLNNIEGG